METTGATTVAQTSVVQTPFERHADHVSAAVIRYHRALAAAHLPHDLITKLTEDFNHSITGTIG